MQHTATTTRWDRFRETLGAMGHAFRVGRAYESGQISVQEARILMTGSAESGEPRIVRVDLAPMSAAELRAATR